MLEPKSDTNDLHNYIELEITAYGVVYAQYGGVYAQHTEPTVIAHTILYVDQPARTAWVTHLDSPACEDVEPVACMCRVPST